MKVCKACGFEILEKAEGAKSWTYAYRELVCYACYVWSLRAVVQIKNFGRIRQLLPVAGYNR